MIIRKSGVAMLALCAVLLGGCVQFKTLITLNPDGSGMLELLLRPTVDTLELLRAMSDTDKIFMDEEELRAFADSLGEGVAYASHQLLDDGDAIQATYQFEDISQLKVQIASPADLIAPEGVTSSSSDAQYLTMGFEASKPAHLTVAMPISDPGEPAEMTEEERAENERQFQTMLADARFTFELAFQGNILETNAIHHKESTVTLVDLDFNGIMADKELMGMMVEQPKGPTPALLAQLAERGFTFDVQEQIDVVFE